MALTQNDVYIVQAIGTILGQQWVNNYWYRVAVPGSAETAADDLVVHVRDNVYVELEGIATDEWTLDLIESYVWADTGKDRFAQEPALVGDDALNLPLPSNICCTFRSPKGNPGERYSFRRIAGLTTANYTNNSIPTATELTAMATAMGAVVAPEGSAILVPVQVRTSTLPIINSGVQPAVNRQIDGTWTYRIGSQNSRKPGYGS